MHPFALPKRGLLEWVQKRVSLSVIQKNSALLKTLLLKCCQQTQHCRKKGVSCTRTGNLPKLWVVVEDVKGVFHWLLRCMICFEWLVVWLCSFLVLMLLCFCFLCIWYSCKSVKMRFPYFLAYLISCVLLFGFRSFRVRWGPSLFWFSFCFVFCFVFGFPC